MIRAQNKPGGIYREPMFEIGDTVRVKQCAGAGRGAYPLPDALPVGSIVKILSFAPGNFTVDFHGQQFQISMTCVEEAPVNGYADGQQPLKGDLICHQTKFQGGVRILALSMEERQTWIVTSVCGDMVRCKCDGAEKWNQAHYTNQMCLLKRGKRNSEPLKPK